MPLDEDVDLGQTGHIADHEVIHAHVNDTTVDAHPQYLLETAASAAYAPLAARAARAYRGSALSLPNATLAAIGLDAESFDSDGLHDNAINNTRLTLNKVGLWLVQGQVSYGGVAGGMRQVRISVNGAQHSYTNTPGTVATQTVLQATALVRAAAATDYAELSAYQDSGGAINLGAGAAETWLAATYLGA